MVITDPRIVEALREAQKNGRDLLGKVKVFGFDGLEESLQAIEAGHIGGHGGAATV